jgi:DNA-binding response OmpR family regulator
MTAREPRYRILNVNDDPASLRLKSAVLTEAGFEVTEAERAADVRRLVATDPPDLLLLDVNLPDGNGIDVCRDLQQPPESADTTVRDWPCAIVLISANLTQPEDIARGMLAGADA